MEFSYDDYIGICRCFTPFVYYPVESNIIKARTKVIFDLRNTISGGVIHCFVDEEEAKDTADMYPFVLAFKAIIPKGTKYIEGSDNYPVKKINNYGAKCIKIVDSRFDEWIETKKIPKEFNECL